MIRYPQHLLTDHERILREFNPHWRVLLLPAVWSVVAVGLLSAVWIQFDLSGPWRAVFTALVAVVWTIMSIQELADWYFTTYVLTNERLVVRRGILKRSGYEIPLEAIDNVLFERNLLERALGYGDLTIESAQGQNYFANIPRPEEFQAELYAAREKRTMHLESGGLVPPDGAEHTIDDLADHAEASAAPARDRVAELERLAALHKSGDLSDDEFQRAKARLLEAF